MLMAATAPVAGQVSSIVTIAVPPTAALEGTTTLTIAAGSAGVRGLLLVKSNTSWVLRALSTGGSALLWRTGDGQRWRPLDTETIVLTGGKGVHVIEFEVRRMPEAAHGPSVVVSFAVQIPR